MNPYHLSIINCNQIGAINFEEGDDFNVSDSFFCSFKLNYDICFMITNNHMYFKGKYLILLHLRAVKN